MIKLNLSSIKIEEPKYCAMPIFNKIVSSEGLALIQVLRSIDAEEEANELLKLGIDSAIELVEEGIISVNLKHIKCQLCPISCPTMEDVKEVTFKLLTNEDYLTEVLKEMQRLYKEEEEDE